MLGGRKETHTITTKPARPLLEDAETTTWPPNAASLGHGRQIRILGDAPHVRFKGLVFRFAVLAFPAVLCVFRELVLRRLWRGVAAALGEFLARDEVFGFVAAGVGFDDLVAHGGPGSGRVGCVGAGCFLGGVKFE